MSDKIISASEIGAYVYCSRAWWLRRKEGKESRNIQEMADGTRAHEIHGVSVQAASFARVLAVALFLLGILLLFRLILSGG